MGDINSFMNQGGGNYGAPLGSGMVPYTGSPVMMGGGQGPTQGGGGQMGHSLGPMQSILQPVNSPGPGPTGGSNAPPNFASYGQPGRGSGQVAPSTGASPTMGSK